jgi:photosystem II stability/assembly factor-like uncharacterized protein
MQRIIITLFLLIGSISISIAQTPSANQEASAISSFFQPVKYRNIGPFRGGRSVCATGVPGDPLTYYMGTTGGGVWKTEDAGQHWRNITDGYVGTGSVGAVAVSSSQPNIVYIGMGEHAPRAVMTSHGDGVYKSTDAGKSWKHLGLKETQHISRIIIHPRNPDIIWVAAQGQLYGRNEERGIFKSIDGGETWEKVLYVDDRTGCAELSIDPNDPNKLYAAMWEHQRLPWQVISGGPGSGLYKSVDGGKTWKEMKKGLPAEKGKMAIAVCPSQPEWVYALIEGNSNEEKGGLFVSKNAGNSWSRVSADHRLIQRAWYYTEVFVDPQNENTVYVMSAPALRSIDGGKNWSRLSGTHGDFHDLWINPTNSKNLCISNDGGAAISFNYGKTWSTQSNMPTSQFYRVNVDDGFPYRIYGGQQDNSSISIAHREFGSSGIGPRSWKPSAGGESAFLAFDKKDPRVVMGGSYLGYIEILDNQSGEGTKIVSEPIQYLGMAASEMKYRFNWNAPIICSQHDPSTFYHAAQILLRTQDQGQSWEEVSPDLTRNQKDKQPHGGAPLTIEAVGAENYGTISYVVESPHQQGVIWVGTDDGYVQLTKDGGENWTNVTPKGLEECLVNAIDVSPHDPATAYIATTRYKFNDHRPRLLKTTNFGKSWTDITGNIPQGAFTRVVREDNVRKDLLVAGTELGMYISWNGGKEWHPFNLNLPVTPILDLIIRHDDMVIATSGRAFWVLDDMGLLRQYEGAPQKAQLYKPEDAYLASGGSPLNGNSKSFKGTHPLRGVNPANGVVIYYNLPTLGKDQQIELTILDSNGNEVRRISSQKDKSYKRYDGGPPPEPTLSKSKGLNRFVWDMRYPIMTGAPTAYIEGSFRGHRAIPGSYQLQLKVGDQVLKSEFELLKNPLYDVKDADYAAYHEFMQAGESSMNEMHSTVNAMLKTQQQLSTLLKQLTDEKHADLKKEAQQLVDKMKAWDAEMIQRKSKAYDDVENFPNKFTAEYIFVLNNGHSEIPRVNEGTKSRMKELNGQWESYKSQAEAMMNEELPALNKKLWAAGIGAVWMLEE